MLAEHFQGAQASWPSPSCQPGEVGAVIPAPVAREPEAQRGQVACPGPTSIRMAALTANSGVWVLPLWLQMQPRMRP